MDFRKTALIACIAITLYYLLLQWPNESLVVDDIDQNDIKESVLIDSDGSLTDTFSPVEDPLLSPVEDPILSSETPLLSPVEDPILSSETPVVLGPVYEIENEDLLLIVEAKSGKFVRSKLKMFKQSLGGESALELLGEVGENLYLGNSGFISEDQNRYLHPNFSSLNKERGVDGSFVYILKGENNGLYHERKITFQEFGYSAVVEDKVTSGMSSTTKLMPYVAIERSGINESGGGFMNPERFAYLGPVFSTSDDVYEKYDFEDINEEPYLKTSPGGWVALIQHYFLTAWVPYQEGTYTYQGKLNDASKRYRIAYTAKSVDLAPGGVAETTNTFYVGPKYPDELSKIQENLGLTVDYGFLFWLGKPMYWVLEKGDGLFNNWGVAIIFLTIIVKLLTWPLSAKAYRSMGKMRVIQPKMLALQERHADDKQKLSQEMMGLYRKEGVNPLGGCLPMLLQMPFFLAFYWVLLETVQLRHSGFLWIDDLSAMDPFFVLPILNALGMYLSQKMTPSPPNADPTQAQIMKFMPVMFAVLFAWFPAGLVLYWLTNMLIQILQQWWYARTPASSN